MFHDNGPSRTNGRQNPSDTIRRRRINQPEAQALQSRYALIGDIAGGNKRAADEA